MTEQQQRNLALWLLSVCLVIFGMICLGGVTRLTGSGLSMVEWAPVTGVLPPLNPQEWMAVFELYKGSPEYARVNYHMGLEDFKTIFWFEYFHRLLGRFIGLLFLLPMVYFQVRYPLPMKLRWQLLGLFLLGGLQGLLGWYMVQSGLVNDPHVSQYRLVAHLTLALCLYAVIFWMAAAYFVRNSGAPVTASPNLRRVSQILLVTVAVTIIAGGFVAGTRAGFAFNTFPLMHGRLIPEGYGALSPWWLNLFENVASVQFNHRLLATLSLLLAVAAAWLAYRSPRPGAIRSAAYLCLVFLSLQYLLGILTLLNHVPVALGAIHQGFAVLVLTSVLILLRVQFAVHPAR